MSVQELDPLARGPCADWPMGTLTTASLPPRAAKPNPMQRILTRWQGGSQVKRGVLRHKWGSWTMPWCGRFVVQ